jgi:hypothetical protein
MDTVWGVVKQGVVVPDSPLPEGTRVEIRLPDTAMAVPPELQEEFDGWDRASAKALNLVEAELRKGQ